MAETPGDTATLNDEEYSLGAHAMATDSPRSQSSGVDIHRAEEDFNTLSRTLTARSETGDRLKWQRSMLTVKGEKDLEKGIDTMSEKSGVFDLREYLSSSNDAHQGAGIKHKVCIVASYSPIIY